MLKTIILNINMLVTAKLRTQNQTHGNFQPTKYFIVKGEGYSFKIHISTSGKFLSYSSISRAIGIAIAN